MKHLLNPTRGRIISSLRAGERTVNDLAVEVGLTDNAIRSHLEALPGRPGRLHGLCRDPKAGGVPPGHPIAPDRLAYPEARLFSTIEPEQISKIARTAVRRLFPVWQLHPSDETMGCNPRKHALRALHAGVVSVNEQNDFAFRADSTYEERFLSERQAWTEFGLAWGFSDRPHQGVAAELEHLGELNGFVPPL